MIEVLKQFQSIIIDYHHTNENSPGTKSVERYQITFIDHSRRVVYESRKGEKFKYGYQSMSPDHETIIRWDNTPHFPDFPTYPFHRHLGPAETAEPFPAISLAAVLTIIRDHFQTQSPQ